MRALVLALLLCSCVTVGQVKALIDDGYVQLEARLARGEITLADVKETAEEAKREVEHVARANTDAAVEWAYVAVGLLGIIGGPVSALVVNQRRERRRVLRGEPTGKPKKNP